MNGNAKVGEKSVNLLESELYCKVTFLSVATLSHPIHCEVHMKAQWIWVLFLGWIVTWVPLEKANARRFNRPACESFNKNVVVGILRNMYRCNDTFCHSSQIKTKTCKRGLKLVNTRMKMAKIEPGQFKQYLQRCKPYISQRIFLNFTRLNFIRIQRKREKKPVLSCKP